MRENNKIITRVGGVKRDVSLDAGAGILMMIVITLHSSLLSSEPFSLMHFFSFFMPWFFYKSGMFHKENERITQNVLIKYFKRLGIPYLFVVLSMGVLKFNTIPFDKSIITIAAYLYNVSPLKWFLEALLITNILLLVIPKRWPILLLSLLLSFVISDILDRHFLSLPYLIREVPNAMIYMIAGYLLKEMQYKYNRLSGLGVIAVLYLLFIFIYPSKVDMRLQQIMYGSFEIAVIGNIVGIVLFNNSLKIVERFIPQCMIYLGRNSFAYYVLHIPIIVVLRFINKIFDFQIPQILFPIVVLLLVPPIIYITKKLRMSFVIGVN